jgi:invasion protein IalB
MNAEKEHQPQQALHGLVQVVHGEWALFLCQRREGERNDCQYQQEHNNDGSPPEPQIALFELPQPALDLDHAKVGRFSV